jgi:carboxymethylenebutenolidase
MGEFITLPAPSGGRAYLAVPRREQGPGVLVLHAWWGLNRFFTSLCDRLAEQGYLAMAPDLYGNQLAGTIEEAQALLNSSDNQTMFEAATTSLELLASDPRRLGNACGALGFSLGGAWGVLLSALRPALLQSVVIYYGVGEADFSKSRASYQGHFAEGDEWEPEEGVRQMEASMHAAGLETEFYFYPESGHWFFEADRPNDFRQQSAALAWDRTLDFLRRRLY